MTGLTKLVQAIEEQAQAEAQQIVEQAREKAQAQKQQAQQHAQSQAQKARGEAELQAVSLLEQAKREAEQAHAMALLWAQNEGIERVFEKSLSRAAQAPEYFAALERGIASQAEPIWGELLLSQTDLNQLPDGFLQRVQSRVPEGAQLILSDETLDSEGGFVLRYPTMEKNGTLRALLEQNRPEWTERVARFFFEEAELK